MDRDARTRALGTCMTHFHEPSDRGFATGCDQRMLMLSKPEVRTRERQNNAAENWASKMYLCLP